MFKKKSNRPPRTEDGVNVPPTAYEKGKAEWFERVGGPVVERARWFLMSLFLAMCLGVALYAISVMAPLKTVVPYQIEVDKHTGDARATKISTERFVVDERQKKFFLGRWVVKTLSIDPYTTKTDIVEAFGFVRGKAIEEYKELMAKTQPISRLAKDKSLTRMITIISTNFVADGSALIRFEAEERSAGLAPSKKRYSINMHFEVVPPTTEKEIYENPNGIFITHFALQEETQ